VNPWSYGIASALVVLLAHWRGSLPERLAAWLLLAGFLAALIHMRSTGIDPADILNPVQFTIDSLTWLLLVGLALRANRVWPLFLCALQTVIVLAHVLALLGLRWDLGLTPVHRGMAVFAQVYQLPVLLAGLLAHVLREWRIGPYRDWRPG
jgi:hypothetical protein